MNSCMVLLSVNFITFTTLEPVSIIVKLSPQPYYLGIMEHSQNLALVQWPRDFIFEIKESVKFSSSPWYTCSKVEKVSY